MNEEDDIFWPWTMNFYQKFTVAEKRYQNYFPHFYDNFECHAGILLYSNLSLKDEDTVANVSYIKDISQNLKKSQFNFNQSS